MEVNCRLTPMSQLLDEITSGWKEAMKSGDTARRDTLSGLRAAIRTAEINARLEGGLDDAAAQQVVEKEAKKRREAIEEYLKANRSDLADKEKAELEIIATFLPAQLTQQELEELVKSTIAAAGATTTKDLGRVMGLLVPKIAGRADGKQASALVKGLLA